MRLALCALAIMASPVMGSRTAMAGDPDVLGVRVTYYAPTGDPTYSGEMPYPGSAGCSFDIPLYSVLEFEDGQVFQCIDRGDDGWMGSHVDVYCEASYQECIDSLPGGGSSERQPARVLAWGGL